MQLPKTEARCLKNETRGVQGISALAINNVPFLKPRETDESRRKSWGRWQMRFESVAAVWVSKAQRHQKMLDFSSSIRYARMSKPSTGGPQPCQALCPIRQNIAFAKETRMPAESLVSLVGLKPPGWLSRTGFGPLSGLKLSQKPAFLTCSFNQKNEKLQTHSEQMEQPQMGTGEVCYNWPKTQHMKEMKKCSSLNVRSAILDKK